MTNPTLPIRFKTWLEYADKLADAGDNDGALLAYDHHLKINPDDYEALFAAGLILYSIDRSSEALPYLKKAYRLQPEGEATEYYDMVCEELEMY